MARPFTCQDGSVRINRWDVARYAMHDSSVSLTCRRRTRHDKITWVRLAGLQAYQGRPANHLALKGRDLGRSDGKLYFLVINGELCFHYTAQELLLAGDDWTRFDVKLQPSGWERSWSRSADVCRQYDPIAGVDSFGISIRGFRAGRRQPVSLPCTNFKCVRTRNQRVAPSSAGWLSHSNHSCGGGRGARRRL